MKRKQTQRTVKHEPMTASKLSKVLYDMRTGRRNKFIFDLRASDLYDAVGSKREVLKRLNQMMSRGYNQVEAVRALAMQAGYAPKLKEGVTDDEFEKAVKKYNAQLKKLNKGVPEKDLNLYDTKRKRSAAEKAKVLSSITGGAQAVQSRTDFAYKQKVLDSIDEMEPYMPSSYMSVVVVELLKSTVSAMSGRELSDRMKAFKGKALMELFYSEAVKIHLSELLRVLGITHDSIIDYAVSSGVIPDNDTMRNEAYKELDYVLR